MQMRGMSSALSAASSACDHVRNWVLGTEPGVFVSMGVISDGSYGAPKVCCLPASHVVNWHLTCSVIVENRVKWNGEHVLAGPRCKLCPASDLLDIAFLSDGVIAYDLLPLCCAALSFNLCV